MASNTALKDLLAVEPAYRVKQIHQAWFDTTVQSYEQVTTLPASLREQLKNIPWMSVKTKTLLTSQNDNTRKVLLELFDKQYIELVIMGRKSLKKNEEGEEDDLAPDRYTICISSQAGCPMKCAFCATGKQGFKRNLSVQEIVDQYRYAQQILAPEGARVANIVLMGQGEPLLNYENVKEAIKILLNYTDLGETKITVSTAGVVSVMEKILIDDFPPVRWAISLHSAIEESRKQIMPSNKNGFLEFLVDWANKYDARYPSRTHFIGLEYIMLHGVNDDDKHLEALIKLSHRMPHVRVNLIPYNSISDEAVNNKDVFARTPQDHIEYWHEELMRSGLTTTVRYSQGQDIAAACGQLRNKVK
jgi:23S rRNA (adenine2503-C2)-methyltransferase